MSLEKDEKGIDTLLGKLGTDDSFRKTFSLNPRAALASLGLAALAAGSLMPVAGAHAAEPGHAADGQVPLASKEVFLKARDALRNGQKVPFEPINLDFNGRSVAVD